MSYKSPPPHTHTHNDPIKVQLWLNNITNITKIAPIEVHKITTHHTLHNYSLRFKTKVTFGHDLRYETKGTFGKISLKLHQTNWYVARNNVNVVDDELPSQSANNLHLFNN
jgi:hypothetical protein